MGLRLSGGPNINSTFTTTVGTRQEIVTGIETALASAGWTTISGGGSADVLMQSGLTAQGLQFRVRLFDQGSGNCARVFVRSVDGIRVQNTPCYLLPAAGKVFRVIACPFHAFVFTANPNQAREFACFGTLWVPASSGATEIFWSHCNAESDTGVSVRPSFRTRIGFSESGNMGTGSYCYNGTIWHSNDNNNIGVDQGVPRLIVPMSAMIGSPSWNRLNRWQNDAFLLTEALLGWGRINNADEGKISGQLFDAWLSTSEHAQDTTKTVNSRTFWVVTANNTGVASTHARGSLLLLVP